MTHAKLTNTNLTHATSMMFVSMNHISVMHRSKMHTSMNYVSWSMMLICMTHISMLSKKTCLQNPSVERYPWSNSNKRYKQTMQYTGIKALCKCIQAYMLQHNCTCRASTEQSLPERTFFEDFQCTYFEPTWLASYSIWHRPTFSPSECRTMLPVTVAVHCFCTNEGKWAAGWSIDFEQIMVQRFRFRVVSVEISRVGSH